MSRNFLIVDPEEGIETLKALASPVRVGILKLLHQEGPMNVNAVAAAMDMPQSSISANVQSLEDAGLIRTETQRAKKGNQKICHPLFDEVLVMFKKDTSATKDNVMLKISEFEGRPVREFLGIPIRTCDQILNTEARVV